METITHKEAMKIGIVWRWSIIRQGVNISAAILKDGSEWFATRTRIGAEWLWGRI